MLSGTHQSRHSSVVLTVHLTTLSVAHAAQSPALP